MKIKAAYRLFRRWQRNPFRYQLEEQASYHCNNCGHDFVGNFCPYCSQKSGLGRITWRSVSKSIAEVWGMHNRSLLYSLVQLLLRPGYFISDYINGKRQVSFPHVKMLAIVALMGVFVDFFTGAIHGMIHVETPGRMSYITTTFSWLNVHINGAFPPPSDYLDYVFSWLNTHPDLLSLLLLCLLIVPNYYIFRFAPVNTQHTMPQGFFIQVFSTVVFLILNMAYDITSLGWLVIAIGMIMVFLTYKQLFGYNTWGTLWRVVTAFACAFILLSILLSGNYAIHLLREMNSEEARRYFLNIPIGISILVIVLWLSHSIGKKT